MPLPKVVIVGRPNVGKSSLLNWISGRRIAIVDDVSGVTRDRVGALAQVGDEADPRYFELVDTGGIGMVDRDDLTEHVERQIETALAEADLVLFVVDVREGRMPLDEDVAQRLRYVNAPVILVLNKADTPEMDDRVAEFTKLGRGKPVAVSTHQNRNKKVLLKYIAKLLPESAERPVDEAMKVAVVGRPNTGKSTFINNLARAERMIVSEVPGTTRDSVDVRFELDGLPFVAIDTAGVRRKAKIRDDLDYYSIHRAERSIRRADVVLLFIDPTMGVSRLDKQLADYVAKQYKPCIFTINKWDLMLGADPETPSTHQMNKFATSVQHAFRTMAYAPLAFITAKTGKNVKSLLNLSQSMYKQAQRRVSTGTLNRVVRAAVEAHPPSPRENRTPRIYYATQVGTAPPTIVLFVNSPSLLDATYQRYLLNVFRRDLPFRDVPIKLYLRSRTQADPRAARERSAGDFDAVDIPAADTPWAGDESGTLRELDRDVNDLLAHLDE
ncbi:MAG TPA: ribosome biogenesis GTPase Der [Isosphaeraceae bacterium]|nr:ribosome biogenesis GTPase Der [Isosphaeraceae bacterium]